MGKGGKRPNSGRPPNWFKEFCEEELAKDQKKALRMIGKIARNEAKFERAFNDQGRIIKTTIGGSASDMIAATEFLRDSSVGKPTQEIEHKGNVGPAICEIVVKTVGA